MIEGIRSLTLTMFREPFETVYNVTETSILENWCSIIHGLPTEWKLLASVMTSRLEELHRNLPHVISMTRTV